MRLRDLLSRGVFLAVATLHHGLQWYAWKMHIHEGAFADDVGAPFGDSLWSVLSSPLFTLVPRRIQNLYFVELLVGNSMVWGLTLTWIIVLLSRALGRGPRRVTPPAVAPKASVPPRLDVDRLVELKKLLDNGLIGRDEFQQKRATILSEL